MSWHSVTWHGMSWLSVTWHRMTWHDKLSSDTTDVIRYDVVRYEIRWGDSCRFEWCRVTSDSSCTVWNVSSKWSTWIVNELWNTRRPWPYRSSWAHRVSEVLECPSRRLTGWGWNADSVLVFSLRRLGCCTLIQKLDLNITSFKDIEVLSEGRKREFG